MDNKKDLMDQIITEDLMNEAKAIEEEIAETQIDVPDELVEKMRMQLQAQIDEYEKERLYAKLSEEDRKALEVGRKVLNDKEDTVVYRKVSRKSRRMYVALAAVLVLVMAMGLTSVGGKERIARMIGINVGNRKLVQVNTDEDNYIVTSNDEEETYQELKDVFGVDPVKIFFPVEEMQYKDCIIDEELQIATLEYEYEGENIHYFISSAHTTSSWGFDLEDELVDESHYTNEKGVDIAIKEYESMKNKTTSCCASFSYKGLEYHLVGVINRPDFEKILKNLIFF